MDRYAFSTFLTCCLLAGLAYLSADIFLPSVVSLSIRFQTSVHTIQLATATIMMGLALSQLLAGPLSEAFGRKPVVLSGLLVTFLGTLITCLSMYTHLLWMFFMGQIIQGIGLGASALFRAILRDRFDGKELLNKSNFVSIFNSLLAPGATTIGGLLEVYFGSTYVFIFLSMSVLTTLLYSYCYLPETYPDPQIEKSDFRYIVNVYHLVLQHKVFRGYCFCTMATYLSYFAWVITLPVYAIKTLHWTPDTLGNTMLATSATAMVTGGFVNKILIQSFEVETVMQWGWSIMLASAVILCVHESFFATNPLLSFAMMMMFQFGSCFLWSNYFIRAFEPFTESAGYASALYATSQISGSMLAAFIAGFLPENNLLSLSVLLILTTMLTWGFHYIKLRMSKTTVEELLNEQETTQKEAMHDNDANITNSSSVS